MRIVLKRCCLRVWVAITCSTSDVPMPKASAPKAPCVAVWLSPHTSVVPGSVKPVCGPTMCTMPWPGWPRPKSVTPNSRQLRIRVVTCSRAIGLQTSSVAFCVEMSWSIVASIRSGRRSFLPASLRPEKACGEVTSWSRWRSM